MLETHLPNFYLMNHLSEDILVLNIETVFLQSCGCTVVCSLSWLFSTDSNVKTSAFLHFDLMSNVPSS